MIVRSACGCKDSLRRHSSSYRDVFVFDGGMQSIMNSEDLPLLPGDLTHLKHPSSKHIVANYATHIYSHNNYHFNALGDFSLIVSPAFYASSLQLPSFGTNDMVSAENVGKPHHLYVWPDSIFISNLLVSDVPAICRLLCSSDNISSLDGIDLSSADRSCPPRILTDNNYMAICAISKYMSIDRALNIHKEFQRQFDLQFPKGACPVLHQILTSEMSGHRKGTGVLLLPHNDSFDSFMPKDRIQSVVARYKWMSDQEMEKG
jgi:hypothetical protein